MISVIIPLYNKKRYIKNSVHAVLSQTYKDFELLVVDDGSTDGSVSELKNINDTRVRILQKVNGGVSSARNYGIKEAKYNYVAFLDADDHWYPDHLENIVMLIRDFKEAKVFAGNFELVYPNKKRINYNKNLKTGYIKNYFYLIFKNKKPIHSSAVAVKKNVFKKVGGFDESLVMGEDIKMWYKLAKKHKIAFCSSVSASYIQKTDNNINKNTKNLPHPSKTFVYHIEFRDIANLYEFKYLKKQIFAKTIKYLINHKRIDYFFIMIKKHWKNYLKMHKRHVFLI